MNERLAKLIDSLEFARSDAVDLHRKACHENALAAMLIEPLLTDLLRMKYLVERIAAAMEVAK